MGATKWWPPVLVCRPSGLISHRSYPARVRSENKTSHPFSAGLRASRRVLCLSKFFEPVTDKIMAIAEGNIRMPLRAVMVVGRVAHL